MTDTGKLEALAGAIKTAFPDAIMGTRLVLGELTVHGRRPRFAEVAQYCVTIPRGVSRCRTQPMPETFTILAFSLTIRAVP